MTKDVLTLAWEQMQKRHFGQAIRILEERADVYEDNAEYYIIIGIACLYCGDIGAAGSYFSKARKINLTDTRLLLGQAAIFLRRGDTERALQYYLEILDNEPGNKTAKDALEFIRVRGNYDTICRWVDTGRLEQFYPPLGVNKTRIIRICFSFILAGVFAFMAFRIFTLSKPENGTRMDISSLILSDNEKHNSQDPDLSGQLYHYLLSGEDITKSYNNALKFFQNHQDNLTIVEINRILNSNASLPIKQKARVLLGYVEEPTFDTIKDSPSISDVEKDPLLYLDCFVSWSGRVSDVTQDEHFYSCRFLVGYEDMKKIDGIVDLTFETVPSIEVDKPVKILAKIGQEDGKIVLYGKSVYQSVKF